MQRKLHPARFLVGDHRLGSLMGALSGSADECSLVLLSRVRIVEQETVVADDVLVHHPVHRSIGEHRVSGDRGCGAAIAIR